MAYPVLAAQSTWWTPTVSSVKRKNITEIEIVDSYTPDASVTVVDSWDASAAKNGSITCYVIGTKLIMAGNGSGKIAANEDSTRVFSDIDYEDYYTNVVNFIGVELLDVSNVISLDGAFASMSKVNSLNVTNWVTDNVTTIRAIFNGLSKITSIDVSNWNTRNMTDLSYTFHQCTLLESIDLNNWNVGKVANMSFMFRGCNALKSINVSNWNTSSLTNMREMFRSCPLLIELDVSKWDVSKIEDMQYLFANCSALTSLDLSSWDVHNVTTMKYMFSVCENLSSLGNISNWNTSNCTNMEAMFNACYKLLNLDVSNFNTSKCTNMAFMFYSCSSLKEIDVSNWDVSKNTNLDHFAAHAGLKRKGMEKWDTSSLVNANAAFHNCAEEELDLSGWDVSKVQFFTQMFENSPNLKRVKGLEKWNTSAGIGFDEMFERCSKLEEVNLSSFDTRKAKNGVVCSGNNSKTATLKNMFLSCSNLKKVTVGPNFSINGDGTNTTAGNKAILPTPSTDYITGADGNWYAFNGEPYAPNAIKDKTAETYFASFPLCQDQDVIVKNGSLIDTAKAIREKNGATDHYSPAQFGAAIRAL